MGKTLGYGEITVANMTEPFTVMLTNEAQQFATDSNRKVTSAQSYYTDIIVIRGSQERTDYTIGNITSGSGITVSKSSKRVTFSVSAGATIGADTGVIEIPITLDGQTVKKQFSWSCGKQGPQGVKGENGNKGKSVQSVIEYYLATSASSGVTSSTSGWSTDPTTQKLTAEKKYLWNCKQTVYDDGARGSITAPVICGTYGEKGDKGDDGLNGTNLWINPLFESDKPQLWTVADGVTAPNGSKVNKLANRDHHNNDTAFPVFPGHQYRITVYRKLISGTVTLKAGIWYTEQTSGVAYDTYVDTSSTTSLTDGWEEATYNFTVPNGKSKGCVYFQIEQPNSGGTTTWYISNVTCVDITGLKGSDGISPKVTLSKSGDTTTISIVDATGTHTQTVKDGTNGTPGAAGKDGKTSYFHVKYSNDGGKTFTGNSGEDTGIYMGSYTDYTEADSTDVGKYTWIKVKGDKGDTGQKGQDGTSIKITSKSVTYQTSTSGTTAPTGTWSTTVPTVNNGQYLWTKTTVQYSDGNKTEAYSVSYKGTNGTNGTSVTVSKTEVTYQVSTSGTTAPTGTWSTTMPSCDQGQYLWTKTYVKYSDGKDTTSYSVSYKGVDGEKFSWNLIQNGKGNEKRGFFKNFSSVNITEGYGEITLTSKHNYIGIGLSGFVLTPRQYEVGKKVTWSYDIMYTKWDFPTGTNHQEFWLGQRYTNAPSGETATGQWVGVTAHDLPVVGQNGCELNKWFHVEVTKTIPTQASSNVGHQEVINFYNSTDISATVTFRMKNVKLEYGDTATPWSPSQSDLEGRGVSQTVQYYLATSQASGVTSSTSGWSTDITTQKLTADKKYLWNCYQTKYSDGTSEPISTPKVIGVYGDKGTSTKIIRTGYKYTQNNIDTFSASGYSGTWDTADATTGLKVGDNVLLRVKNTTKGSDCLIFASITAIPSNYSLTCTSYGLIDNGADGQDGKNAKNLSITPSSQYFKSTDGGKTFAPNTITIKPTIQGEISFGKWQYSIDGGVSFADVVSGQKGLTVSNNVLTVSKDSSLYSDAVTMVTFRAVASDSSFYDTCSIAKIYDVSDIGDGRNLLTGVSSYTKDAPFEKTDSRADGWIVYQNIITSIELEAGKKYVLQAKTDGNWTANHDTNGQDPSKKLVTLWLCSDTTNDFFDMRQGYVVFTPTVTAKYKLRVNQYSNGTDAYTIHLWDIKLEKGSSPTGWTPAPEDVQTAILSTKSEISDVSLKVDKNKQAIEQRVEKTTYQQDLNLVKGDISKANEGLNKWRYEIYPKSLFTNKPEDQRKISLDVFARNKNIIPTQSILLDDTKLGYSNYDDNYIGYAVTFVKMSEATKLETTFVHDDAGSFYLNGKLICTNGNNNFYSSATPDTVSCTLVKGWNCLEVVINEGTGSEGFKFGTVLSQLSTCQLMNCYYAMVTGRESQITNTLVQNTIDIEGVGTKVSKVTSVIGDNGENFTSFKNDYSDFKQTMNGFKATVGQTYVTKDDFNGLEIGGVNLFVKSTASRGWWISNTGVLNADGGWGYSDYIDVSGMKNYIASGFTNLGISTATCFYDSNKTFISGVASKNQNSQDSKRKTLPIPSNAKYMRFSFALADIDTLKIEQGTKATAYSPAPEDDEINGQNLVSNLPSNWEQGTVTEGSTTGTTYANTKSSSAGSVRPKELIPVSGNITISTAYSNQSKKPIRHWIAAYDINKNYLGNNYVSNAWNSFPRTLNMKDAKYIAIMVGYTDSSAITPSDISQICLKIERGTSATPFTLAPEDVNGKIVNVETIANQTAKKFEWIVNGGDSSSNFTLTDRVADLVAERINFNGLVTFSGLAKSTQDKINSPTSGNLITVSPTNPTSNYDNTTFSIVSDDVGGQCIQTTAQFVPFTNYASNIFKPGEQIYYNINVPNWSSTTFDANLGIWFFTAEKKCVANNCTRVTLQRTTWNRLSGYITVPTSGWSGIIYYVIGIENPNKYQLGLVSNSYIEKTTSYATTYASSAVNWVTNNGSSTTSLNSMVKKWTDGAVSDTTQINGGWIKANTITASKIALADFTNYSQLTRDTAATYGFAVTDDTDGTWFSTQGIRRDQFISETFPCNGGESYLIEYDISTNAKGANNSTDTKNYIDVAIGVYGYTGTVGSNGLPNKATNIWYATRVTGSEAAAVTHVKTTITTSTATKQFRIFLQSNGYYFEGTTKIRNLSVRRMYGGTLIVDGSITADKIATDAIKSRNYISSGGTQGSFLNLSDGSFTSPNLSWDSNGNLIAKNANLSGYINATQGSIGGWNIGDTSLFTGITKSNVRIYDAVNADNAQNMYQKEQHSLILANTYINSFNSSLNSSDHYWHAQGVTINDGEFQVAETLYDPNLVNSDKDRVYYDRGLTRVFGGSITMSRDYSINSDSHSLYAGITFNGEELYIYTSSNILFSPHRTSIFTTEDTSKYNAIETIGDVVVNGKIKASNELQTTASQMRIISGSIGCMLRNDSADFYILRTNAGDPYGDWTNDRPFRINWATNDITCGHNLTANDLIANSWLYCSEVHSSGAVVIGADSESFYWAHGFQIARGTSWGGVCIGDDGQQLRLYGSSIWASHGISTSDENLKENFTTLDQYEDFYMNLNPIGFNYIGDYDGKKTHFGFGAHKTEDVLESEGYDADEFAVVTHRPLVQEDLEKRFGKDVEVDIETEYGVSYTEFIALNTHMIQKTRRELTKVKQEKADLEVRLQAIEAKLGL